MADTYGGYPQSAVNNAKRGIKLNEEQGNKCATDVGKQRARDIVAKRPFSFKKGLFLFVKSKRIL